MDKMIVQKSDGSLVDTQTSAKWAMVQAPGDGDGFGVALFGPHLGREAALHYGSEADCRAFLDALAVELGAVRWDGAKRRFVPVKE